LEQRFNHFDEKRREKLENVKQEREIVLDEE